MSLRTWPAGFIIWEAVPQWNWFALLTGEWNALCYGDFAQVTASHLIMCFILHSCGTHNFEKFTTAVLITPRAQTSVKSHPVPWQSWPVYSIQHVESCGCFYGLMLSLHCGHRAFLVLLHQLMVPAAVGIIYKRQRKSWGCLIPPTQHTQVIHCASQWQLREGKLKECIVYCKN